MKSVAERLSDLRKEMAACGMDAYILCTNDFHGSEYVGEYFKTREYFSGFTGSAGTLVVLKDKSALWTDGRYFLQAENELHKTETVLMKQGMEGVPSIEDYLTKELSYDAVIGFDGRTVSAAFVERLEEAFDKKYTESTVSDAEGVKSNHKEHTVHFVYDKDVAGEAWEKRPALSAREVWMLSKQYTGEDSQHKLKRLREKMLRLGADTMVLTALDDIAWLLNLRGNDVECNPVFLSYMLIDMERVRLYVNEAILSTGIKQYLSELHVEICPYDGIYADLQKSDLKKSVIIDETHANFMIRKSVPESVRVISGENPVTLMKAVKNPVEIENIRKAHIKDGVAVTKFMYWLKKNVGHESITEISAAQKLEEFRMQQQGYLYPSFDPIMAYGSHGAIVHYSADKDSDVSLEARGLFLSDTGGHYLEGTTDITRTYVLGEVSEEEKRSFTLALCGHLRLAAAHFPYGVTGANLDILARDMLWQQGLDYNHGTGHGVGYLLNVHEAPNSFRYRCAPNTNGVVFEEGMVTSDEPGFYADGKYGIRHENLLLCVKAEKTCYGQFMRFEHLTKVPFDKDGIDISLMSGRDIELLNAYHKDVYDSISPYLSPEEDKWLINATSPIVC